MYTPETVQINGAFYTSIMQRIIHFLNSYRTPKTRIWIVNNDLHALSVLVNGDACNVSLVSLHFFEISTKDV